MTGTTTALAGSARSHGRAGEGASRGRAEVGDGHAHDPTARPILVEARGRTKAYGDRQAVRGIDLRVEAGEAVGFLGPNGAGKSSTMRMLATVSAPTSGHLRIVGRDPATDGRAVRARLGVVPQDDTLDADLTVRENLLVYGRYFGLSWRRARQRVGELLEFAQLEGRGDDKVARLSGGMRRRLTIARALVNHPDLLLLDEPTTGLDPQARHLLWGRLDRLREEGVTLVLTTHYMDEAEQLCDRILVIDGGRVVADGTPRALIAEHVRREVLEVRDGGDPRLRDTVLQLLEPAGAGGQAGVEELPGRLLVATDDADSLADHLAGSGVRAHLLQARRATLEDVFLTLTGRALVD